MMVMRMPPLPPLPPKGHRPNEHPQGNDEHRPAINDKLRDRGPGGNQCPDRILFTDAEGTGQKANGHGHEMT